MITVAFSSFLSTVSTVASCVTKHQSFFNLFARTGRQGLPQRLPGSGKRAANQRHARCRKPFKPWYSCIVPAWGAELQYSQEISFFTSMSQWSVTFPSVIVWSKSWERKDSTAPSLLCATISIASKLGRLQLPQASNKAWSAWNQQISADHLAANALAGYVLDCGKSPQCLWYFEIPIVWQLDTENVHLGRLWSRT